MARAYVVRLYSFEPPIYSLPRALFLLRKKKSCDLVFYKHVHPNENKQARNSWIKPLHTRCFPYIPSSRSHPRRSRNLSLHISPHFSGATARGAARRLHLPRITPAPRASSRSAESPHITLQQSIYSANERQMSYRVRASSLRDLPMRELSRNNNGFEASRERGCPGETGCMDFFFLVPRML